MSELKVFSDLTTNEALAKLEDEAKCYAGLYVDMKDGKQRKYVKDKAVLINGLLKKLDRARIDKSKDYKILVESEAANIKGRLEAANEPFTALIDAYNIERAKILAEEKRIEDEKLAVINMQRDHEEGLQLDRLFDFEAKEAAVNKLIEVQAQKDREAKIAEDAAAKATEDAAKLMVKQKEESEAREIAAKQAVIDAESKAKADAEQAKEMLKQQAKLAELDKQAAINKEVARQEAEKKAEADALAKREANKSHMKRVNNEAMQCFIDGGLSEESAKLAVTLLAKKVIKNAQINY